MGIFEFVGVFVIECKTVLLHFNHIKLFCCKMSSIMLLRNLIDCQDLYSTFNSVYFFISIAYYTFS